MNSQFFLRIGPPKIYKAFILLMLIIGVLPIKPIVGFPWNLSGVPFLFLGIYIATKAKRMFKKSKTPTSPIATATQLHQNGIYKLTRNPMYLGIIIGLTGIALLSGRVINLIFPWLYFAIMDRLFITKEEANLKKKFGEHFLDYKRRVRKWI